jgi:hypothetical protein
MVTRPEHVQRTVPKSFATTDLDSGGEHLVRDRSERRPESIMNNAG